MTEATLIDMGSNALAVTLMIATPLLLVSLITGLLVSIFQATTQIHEMTLTFVPKVAAVVLVLMIAGPWMISTVLTYTTNIFLSLPALGR